ncbi:hypothetical protein FN846DRAFT_887335 [Sphaerosporella brunnea]|uniref:Uncharacterized protein n=1 Tax=Sphaerosporella brunnea TaxID=1250544 RepID=A0A5J5F665_9PEZI|nr:hypothetical protein FN846DRAFT_887335 [Sphaerosporella brunnea]
MTNIDHLQHAQHLHNQHLARQRLQASVQPYRLLAKLLPALFASHPTTVAARQNRERLHAPRPMCAKWSHAWSSSPTVLRLPPQRRCSGHAGLRTLRCAASRPRSVGPTAHRPGSVSEMMGCAARGDLASLDASTARRAFPVKALQNAVDSDAARRVHRNSIGGLGIAGKDGSDIPGPAFEAVPVEDTFSPTDETDAVVGVCVVSPDANSLIGDVKADGAHLEEGSHYVFDVC